MLTVEELLKPRYKVIAEYPKSACRIGDIIHSEGMLIDAYLGDPWYENYPHIFKKMKWYEDRKVEDLPLYVKWNDEIYKVIEWHVALAPKVTVAVRPDIHQGWDKDCRESPLYGDILPATSEEYQSYIKTLQP